MWVIAVSLRVNKIASGKTCLLFPNDNSAVKCTDKSDVTVLPGFRIRGSGGCYGKSVDGYCRGKGINEDCNDSFECDVGLMCGMSKKCENAAEEGEYCNNEDRLCKSYLYCQEERCIKYGSVKDHVNPGTNNPDLCESHHIFKGVCSAGPKLDGLIFVEHIEDVCDYDNGEHEPAVCGFHKNGKAICKPGDGDLASDWKDLLSYLNKKPECNPYISHLSMCDYGEKILGREYLKAAIAYWKLHNFVDIQENADCVKDYTNSDYFDIVRRYNSATFVSALFALLITAILFL
jgi:hypothetical protein